MIRFTALVLFGVAVVIVSTVGGRVAAAPVPKHLMKAADGDKAKLQGKWKVKSVQMGGKNILGGLGQNFDMVFEFEGDQIIATANIAGMVQKTTATVKYDTKGTLKTADMRTVDGNGKPVNTGKDEPAYYAFEGDKLLIAGAAPGGKGVVDPLKPGPNDVVFVLVRVKK
jgi:uncharacterized protein (TIGR03067 family)